MKNDLATTQKEIMEILKPDSDSQRAMYKALITTVWKSGFECAKETVDKWIKIQETRN